MTIKTRNVSIPNSLIVNGFVYNYFVDKMYVNIETLVISIYLLLV